MTGEDFDFLGVVQGFQKPENVPHGDKRIIAVACFNDKCVNYDKRYLIVPKAEVVLIPQSPLCARCGGAMAVFWKDHNILERGPVERKN